MAGAGGPGVLPVRGGQDRPAQAVAAGSGDGVRQAEGGLVLPRPEVRICVGLIYSQYSVQEEGRVPATG